MTQEQIDALSPGEKEKLIARNLEKKNRAAVNFLLGLTEWEIERRLKQKKVAQFCAPKKGRAMIQTVEALIDEAGNVHLLESVKIKGNRRALVTILEEEPTAEVAETALLSEKVLAEDWNRKEEDDAWSHLQSGR